MSQNSAKTIVSKLQTSLDAAVAAADKEIKRFGTDFVNGTRELSSAIIDEAKLLVKDPHGGASVLHGGISAELVSSSGSTLPLESKVGKLLDKEDQHRVVHQAATKDLGHAMSTIGKLTDNKDAKHFIETKVKDAEEKDKRKWITADSDEYVSPYNSLYKFYSSLKKQNANVADIQLGLKHLFYYIMSQAKADPADGSLTVYESSIIRTIKEDINSQKSALNKLDRTQLLDALSKSYDVITSDKTDSITRAEYIITIDSIVKAINNLTEDRAANAVYGGRTATTEFMLDSTKVQLGILSIYSRLNDILPISKKINAGSTMTEEQESRFVRKVARIEEYVSRTNIQRDMIHRISPTESVLYSRIKGEVDSLRDIRDPDVVRFLSMIDQAIKPLLANNIISSSYNNDIVVDLSVDTIELNTSVFKLIRDIAYKRKLVGFVDTKQDLEGMKANLKNQASQFANSENVAIERTDFNEEKKKVISMLSDRSINLDYMTQLMNYEAQTEPANADTIYNAIFRSKERIHDSLVYSDDPVKELRDSVGLGGGRVNPDAVRKILPEIDNMINIFARITKTKEFAGPKDIANALYSFVALPDLVDFSAMTASIDYSKIDQSGLSKNACLGNILKVLALYNNEATSIGDVVSPGGIYAKFAAFNKQHGFGGSEAEIKEKYGKEIDNDAAWVTALHGISRVAYDIISRHSNDVRVIEPQIAAHLAVATAPAPTPLAVTGDSRDGVYLITLPVIISVLISGNVRLSPFISRLLFGPNTLVETFCNAVVAYSTPNVELFVPRTEGGHVYDFRASDITFGTHTRNELRDITSIKIARNTKDSINRDQLRQKTEDTINGFINTKQLFFATEQDFHEKKNLVFLLMQHFEVSTNINNFKMGERGTLSSLMAIVEESRMSTTDLSLISDEEIVTMYHNLAMGALHITSSGGRLTFSTDGVSFNFFIPSTRAELETYESILAVALDKLVAKYGCDNEVITQFDINVLGSSREADFVSQNALQALGEVDHSIEERVPELSLARSLMGYTKTFSINKGSSAGTALINATLHVLHDGDEHILHSAKRAGDAASFPNAPFVKDVFVLWNQYNLLNNVYVTLGSSVASPSAMLVSDIDREIKRGNVPTIYGDEKETIANNIVGRYVSILKLIAGRIIAVIEKNLIEVNVNRSSTLARYKLGVADLFGGSDFSYKKENAKLYTSFVLLAEWYFTFFKNKGLYDVKPFVLKESDAYRGLNEAVFAKVYDNIAYSEVSARKIFASVNASPNIQKYIESINQALGFYVIHKVDKRKQQPFGLTDILSEKSSMGNIFSGIPSKLPIGETRSAMIDTSTSGAQVKSRFDIAMSSAHGNIAEVYDNTLVKLLVDINSSFEDVDLSSHDEFALVKISEAFDRKVQGKSLAQEEVTFVEFLNTVDSFEFSNKHTIIANFIDVPIKLADELSLLFEDDYNEIVYKSNYGKFKNILVGNGSLFFIDASGKEIRFNSHIPSMIENLVDVAKSNLIKYSSYVEYEKTAGFEKQINFIEKKRKLIVSKLNSKEFSIQMVDSMLPHAIMEFYQDNMKSMADYKAHPGKSGAFSGDSAVANYATDPKDPDYNPRLSSKNYYTDNSPIIATRIKKAIAGIRTASRIVSGVNLSQKKLHQETLKIIGYGLAIKGTADVVVSNIDIITSSTDYGTQLADAIEHSMAAFKSIIARMVDSMAYACNHYSEISAPIKARNRDEIVKQIAALRALVAKEINNTDYIFFNFFTDKEIADHMLSLTSGGKYVFMEAKELTTRLGGLKGEAESISRTVSEVLWAPAYGAVDAFIKIITKVDADNKDNISTVYDYMIKALSKASFNVTTSPPTIKEIENVGSLVGSMVPMLNEYTRVSLDRNGSVLKKLTKAFSADTSFTAPTSAAPGSPISNAFIGVNDHLSLSDAAKILSRKLSSGVKASAITRPVSALPAVPVPPAEDSEDEDYENADEVDGVVYGIDISGNPAAIVDGEVLVDFDTKAEGPAEGTLEVTKTAKSTKPVPEVKGTRADALRAQRIANSGERGVAFNTSVINTADSIHHSANKKAKTQGFVPDYFPDVPIHSQGSVLRKTLTNAHGPHVMFYEVYHMMFTIFATTNDVNLKNLMLALMNNSEVQNTFSNFSKGLLNQARFAGSYNDFTRSKDYHTVAALGDFTTGVDFKTTSFNKTRVQELLGKSLVREMIALMNINQTGMSSSKTSDENVGDIVHKASSILVMLRDGIQVLTGGNKKSSVLDLSKVRVVDPKEVGSAGNYRDYSDVSVDLLMSADNAFGTPEGNCRDVCAAINYVDEILKDKNKAASMRGSHTISNKRVCYLTPAAFLKRGSDLQAWLLKGLPTALFTLSTDALANVSERMDKMGLAVYAMLANLCRVFGKSSMLPQAPLGLVAKYKDIVSTITSRTGSQQVQGLVVVDTQDQVVARLAEACFIKARVIDIPVFTPFKNVYTPADMIMILKSDFAICAPEHVKCRALSEELYSIKGEAQALFVKELLLTPGSSASSVTTLPDVTGLDFAAKVSASIAPAAVAAINELNREVEYPVTTFNEFSCSEALLATTLIRKMNLVLGSGSSRKIPCSINEYVSLINDIGALLISSKSEKPTIHSYLMSRIKLATACANNAPVSTAKALVDRYVCVIDKNIAALEDPAREESGFGGKAKKDKPSFGGHGGPYGEPQDYGQLKYTFQSLGQGYGGAAPVFQKKENGSFGGHGGPYGEPQDYGQLKYTFQSLGQGYGGAGMGMSNDYAALKHTFPTGQFTGQYGGVHHKCDKNCKKNGCPMGGAGMGMSNDYTALKHIFPTGQFTGQYGGAHLFPKDQDPRDERNLSRDSQFGNKLSEEFGGAGPVFGAPNQYGEFKHVFPYGGSQEKDSRDRHMGGAGAPTGAPTFYGEFKHVFPYGGADYGRPSMVYASGLDQNDYVTTLIPNKLDAVTKLHHDYINGSNVTDIRKNTKEYSAYVTRQDAACNLPALYNVLQNLQRIVSGIVSLSKEWLKRTGNSAAAYVQAVQQYMNVCMSIDSFSRDSMNIIRTELLNDPSIGEALAALVSNIDSNEKGIKNLLEVVLSDVDVILPRATIKRSAFGFMSPVFNALFYADITGVTDSITSITDSEHNIPMLVGYIKSIANVRSNKALAFGKRYEKLPYSNTLTSEDRTVSRNILHLNNIINININPIKLSWMNHTPLFYATEVFGRVFDKSVTDFINASYKDFSDADKEKTYSLRGMPAGRNIKLSTSYTNLISFLVDPLEYYKVNKNSAAGNTMSLPEEFKNGTTRGRALANDVGHPIDITGDGVTTRLLYFWTKEVYKFTRNFVVNRISQSEDNGGIYQNRGMNALVRNEHVFK